MFSGNKRVLVGMNSHGVSDTAGKSTSLAFHHVITKKLIRMCMTGDLLKFTELEELNDEVKSGAVI